MPHLARNIQGEGRSTARQIPQRLRSIAATPTSTKLVALLQVEVGYEGLILTVATLVGVGVQRPASIIMRLAFKHRVLLATNTFLGG